MTSPAARADIITMITQAVASGARRSSACTIVGLSLRTVQRWKLAGSSEDGRTIRLQAPTNALTALEREQLLAIANSAEFGQMPPGQIVPRLADQGIYVASESTFYRVMREENLITHRQAARPAQERSKPRAICATAPNQLYSWDITYLPSGVKGIYFYLYMFIDIYSRKVVGWQVYGDENSDMAAAVLRDICASEKIKPQQVILHSDNGSPMKGATMLATLQTLGVMPSFSRPAVSNDNPYSEAMFRTLKYRPDYPKKAFADIVQARNWVTRFVRWYNNEHRHSAIKFVTPAQRHAGRDLALLAARTALYGAARDANPLRWSGATRNWSAVEEVHLNPDVTIVETTASATNSPVFKKAA
jgi:transposase InsO family protein